jgi:hypothetical protein
MADRTSAPDLPGLDGPQIATTQPAPLAAPQYQAPSAGFDILRQGLNSFFGKAAEGLDAVDKAVQYQRKEDIKGQFFLQRSQVAKDNKQNAEQAAADALAGKPMNPALAQSFAYADNYQKTAGKQHGFDLMSKFMSDVYPKLGPGDNAAAAADAFLKQEYGAGTGNAAYDAAALSTFKQSVDRPILAHIENGTKAVAAQGLQQLQATIAGSIASGQFNAGMVPGIIAQARVLNPMDPASAPGIVAQTIRATAGSNPAMAQTVLAELDKPGSSGTPGRSYHEMFPDAYAQLENGLTSNVVQGRGLQAANAWSDLKRQRTTATTAEQWTDPDNGLLRKGPSELSTIRWSATPEYVLH